MNTPQLEGCVGSKASPVTLEKRKSPDPAGNGTLNLSLYSIWPSDYTQQLEVQ